MRKDTFGFTLIEILVVILVIGILAAYFGQNIYGSTDDAKLKTTEVMLLTRFPEAIASMQSVDKKMFNDGHVFTDSLVKRGVNPTTPFGGKWMAIASRSNGYRGGKLRYEIRIGSKMSTSDRDLLYKKLYPYVADASSPICGVYQSAKYGLQVRYVF